MVTSSRLGYPADQGALLLERQAIETVGMTHDLDGPAVTTMMGIVHAAMRRDLTRARMVLEDGECLTPARRAALSEHLVWLMHFLHEHHDGEDTGLYPMVRKADPSLGTALDAMDAEHELIHPAMDALEASVRAWQQDAIATEGVLEAIDSLEGVLNPHLEHEEREMMPLVSRAITQRQWHAWDQAANIKSKSTMDLAYSGHWMVDGASPAVFDTVVHEVPAIPRFVLLRFLGGPYRRRRTAMWDGTTAAHVPLTTLS
jgi:hemerythrin-like domain-containing protein